MTVASIPNGSRGIVALIEQVFAFMSFGWGQASAPSRLVVPFVVGGSLGGIVAVAGAMVAARTTGQRTPMADRAIRFNLIMGVGFVLMQPARSSCFAAAPPP